MAVKSYDPEDDGARPRRGSGLFRRAALNRQRGRARRVFAGILYILSFIGAVIWGGGGVDTWLALTISWWGLLGAVALQVAFTYGQWVFGGADWFNPFYLACLIGSTTTTVLGYGPIVHPRLTAWVERVAGTESIAGYYAWWLAGGIIVAVALFADWLPEQELLD